MATREGADLLGRLAAGLDREDEDPSLPLRRVPLDLLYTFEASPVNYYAIKSYPLTTQGFRAFLEERTLGELKALRPHVKAEMTLTTALSRSRLALLFARAEEEAPTRGMQVLYGQGEDYGIMEMAQDYLHLLERFRRVAEAEDHTVEVAVKNLWETTSGNMPGTRHLFPHTYALLMEWATAEAPSQAHDTRALECLLLDLTRGTAKIVPHVEQEQALSLLARKVPRHRLLEILWRLREKRMSLTLEEWENFMEGVDDYLDMPLDWWLPLVRATGNKTKTSRKRS